MNCKTEMMERRPDLLDPHRRLSDGQTLDSQSYTACMKQYLVGFTLLEGAEGSRMRLPIGTMRGACCNLTAIPQCERDSLPEMAPRG